MVAVLEKVCNLTSPLRIAKAVQGLLEQQTQLKANLRKLSESLSQNKKGKKTSGGTLLQFSLTPLAVYSVSLSC